MPISVLLELHAWEWLFIWEFLESIYIVLNSFPLPPQPDWFKFRQRLREPPALHLQLSHRTKFFLASNFFFFFKVNFEIRDDYATSMLIAT